MLVGDCKYQAVRKFSSQDGAVGCTCEALFERPEYVQ